MVRRLATGVFLGDLQVLAFPRASADVFEMLSAGSGAVGCAGRSLLRPRLRQPLALKGSFRVSPEAMMASFGTKWTLIPRHLLLIWGGLLTSFW